VVANIAGVVMAAVAAIPGFLDWTFGVPTGSPAKTTGLFHMLANVAALALFASNAFITWDQWGRTTPELGAVTLALVCAGLGLTMVAGWLGWKMVQVHHVGVDLTAEQARLEPRANARVIRQGGWR
jgi:uncharacterized membrane protein